MLCQRSARESISLTLQSKKKNTGPGNHLLGLFSPFFSPKNVSVRQIHVESDGKNLSDK